MRPVAVSLLLVAACGGGGKPAARATTKPAVAAGARPAAELRCVAAGRAIAARAEHAPGDDDKRAQAVASLCTRTSWAATVVECVNTASSQEDTEGCLAKLEPMQHEPLTSLEMTWLPDDFDAMFSAGQLADVGDAPEDDTSCVNAIGDAARFAPAIPLAASDRTWGTALRAAALAPACSEWSSEQRACLAAASLADDAAACNVAQLAKVVGDSDALMKRLAAKRVRAADIACPRVAAEHYADAAWAGKLAANVTAEQRRKTIADSRALMAKACDGESWSADLRACVVVGGGDACFTAAGVPGGAWGFPALGVFAQTGIASCDAYTRGVNTLLGCSKLATAAKERIARGSQAELAQLVEQARLDPDEANEQCQRLNEEIEEMATNIGCAP